LMKLDGFSNKSVFIERGSWAHLQRQHSGVVVAVDVLCFDGLGLLLPVRVRIVVDGIVNFEPLLGLEPAERVLASHVVEGFVLVESFAVLRAHLVGVHVSLGLP